MKEASTWVPISKRTAARGYVMHEGKAIRAGFVKDVFTPALVAVGGEVRKTTDSDVCVLQLL